MRRLLAAAAIVGVFSLASGLPASAGYRYEEKLDRFEGTKTAQFRATDTECKLLKSTKGALSGCSFIYSTENNTTYPAILFYKYSEGWDLLNFKSSMGDELPVIITYSNGMVKRRRLSGKLMSDTVSGGTVLEAVDLHLRPIKDELPRINKIETKYGSAEFMWIVDRELVKKSIDFVEN